MRNLKESIALKVLCYLLIPIFFFILVISIAGAVVTAQYGNTNNDGTIQSFIETESFGEQYFDSIVTEVQYVENYISYINSIKNNKDSYYRYSQIEVDNYDKNVYYKAPDSYYNSMIYGYINYIIIDDQTGELYTNIKSKDYQKEIEEITNKKIYWKYEDESITTNIETINQDNAKYLAVSYSYFSMDNLQRFKVYTYLDKNAFNYSNYFALQRNIYNMTSKFPV